MVAGWLAGGADHIPQGSNRLVGAQADPPAGDLAARITSGDPPPLFPPRAELEASIGLRGALADKRGTVAGRRALALVADVVGKFRGFTPLFR